VRTIDVTETRVVAAAGEWPSAWRWLRFDTLSLAALMALAVWLPRS
jgi:hypothetical protein